MYTIQCRFLFVFVSILLYGCSLDGVVKVDDPEQGRSVNIKEVTTRSGAMSVYASALGKLQSGVSKISENVSMFTDELAVPPSSKAGVNSFDARNETRSTITGEMGLVDNDSYESLNSARIVFSQVRDIVRRLNDPSLSYLVSASYAFEGYAILLLAENFCSGLPLSKLGFDGTLYYESGSSTANMLKAAVSLFDSSQLIDHDSTRFNILSQVGKGRAYLSLGMLDSAYASVADVSVQDAFYLSYSEVQNQLNERPYAFWRGTFSMNINDIIDIGYGIVNQEGTNGIHWFSPAEQIDPRIPMNLQLINGKYFGRAHKYSSAVIMFPLAKGIEKKMIESEYWLSMGDDRWIDAINEARHTKGIQDTLDPGVLRNREDLLFRERAFWFYLDGYRLADYRRLVRQYNRSPYEVYPTGIYEGGSGIETSIYGEAFVFSPQEASNRKYFGCDHKNP